jgi:hypothetical protein
MTNQSPRSDADILEKSTFAAASWESAVMIFHLHQSMFVEKET